MYTNYETQLKHNDTEKIERLINQPKQPEKKKGWNMYFQNYRILRKEELLDIKLVQPNH